jgi:hypothetical protein
MAGKHLDDVRLEDMDRVGLERGQPVAHPAATEDGRRPNDDEIRNLAYRLWEERGCPEGTAEEDWSNAERELCKVR